MERKKRVLVSLTCIAVGTDETRICNHIWLASKLLHFSKNLTRFLIHALHPVSDYNQYTVLVDVKRIQIEIVMI